MRTLPLLLLSTAALAQGVSPYPQPVRALVAYPPDGGSEVFIPGRVDTNITNEYVPIGMGDGAPKLAAEVTGPSNTPVTTSVSGAVEISGYSSVPTVALQNGTQVALTAASINALTYSTGRGICEYSAGDPDSLTVDTTATNIPSSPLAGRTAVKICNLDTSKHMWCNPLGTVSATAGFTILQHACEKFEGLNGGHVSCRCESATCNYVYLEEKCYQQAP